jgi:hypothetical protein
MNDSKKIQKPESEYKSPPKAAKTGWKISEGGNKCLAKPSIQVTAEMESRRVEVSRTRVADLTYVTYYDPLTEVYWAEKSGVR